MHLNPLTTAMNRILCLLPMTSTGAFIYTIAVSMLTGTLNPAQAGVTVSQQPLTTANNVPSNLVLTPSVEWPTVMSMANIGSFSTSHSPAYTGYFDPDKCYDYQVSSSPVFIGINGGTNNYFTPVSSASNHQCSGHWSGYYLNWAATQTIDTFRSSLTGGYRVVDTAGMTILEKARHTGQTSTGRLSMGAGSSSTVSAYTPITGYSYVYTRLDGLGNRLRFQVSNSGTRPSEIDSSSTTPIEYTGQAITASTTVCTKYYSNGTCRTSTTTNNVYSLNVDVQVCVPSLLESNCVQYGSNYKPEGLIQKYNKTFTYSVFGYLNTSDWHQDGAALRAQQKYVGPYTYDPVAGQQTNPNKEWDPNTGVFVQNPDTSDASYTTSTYGTSPAISNSGVINYINKFGETNNTNDKSYDPVSEMYYAAIRYLKHQGSVAAYSSMASDSYGTTYQKADGFPVISTWNDPIKYSCQKNYILGIGDANTWEDKNLPGSPYVGTNYEPSVPSEVTADTTINVETATQKVAALENITINNNPFTGRYNSAYIAGLAYDSHTKDMRPDITGTQTVATYWVDVMENQVLLGKAQNQYWLAAKYGGFKVPTGYSTYGQTTALPTSWWHTNTTTLSTGDLKPDNFFLGGDGATMKTSLDSAFSAISSDATGSIASLSLNSTQLQTGSTVYLAGYQEGVWTGSLRAYAINPTTRQVSTTPTWSASITTPYTGRTVKTSNSNGNFIDFNSSNVTGNGWSSAIVNYILGDSTNEVKNGGSLRDRSTVLGDIVDSQPIYVGAPNSSLFTGATFTGSSSYGTWSASSAIKNRTPTLYVAANDGMLHGFNANTGLETFAYMPYAVWSATTNPSLLASTNYGSGINPHQYFNDGELTVADVYYTTNGIGAWHSILVGTTGRGLAKSIYALDVTDPANVGFLWEKSPSQLGQVIGKPIIAQTSNGGWSVLIGNGDNSSSDTASLIRIPLDGTSNPTVTAYTTNSTTSNGLSTPSIWIADPSNAVSTSAYAGDIQGNLWKFDLTSTTGSGTLVFSTTSQPITAPLLLGKDPGSGHLWAFFGTGQYLSSADISDRSTQSWYGLIVDQTLPVSKTNLVQRSITAETSATATTSAARTITTSAGNMSGKSGWYINLTSPANGAEGERMIVTNQFFSGLLIGSTLIPDFSNPCSPGGTGWVMAINPFTGTNPINVFFDLNNNGNFSDDVITNSDGSTTPSAGIKFDSLTGTAAFTGTVMLNNQNGTITPTNVNAQSGNSSRVSWREIINE